LLVILAVPKRVPLQAAVTLTRFDDRIHIEIDGRPFSDFYFAPDAPKPYLYPLRSASGKIVTRRFPMEKVEGETTSDQHHRSMWLGFKLVNGYDYWENEFSYNNKNAGKAVTRSIDEVKSGEDSGSIAATIMWLSPSGEPQLEEQRRMTIATDGKLRIIDTEIILKAIVKTTFGDSKDGAFSVRVAESMAERKGGLITNSEGGRTMAQTWGKPASWVDYSGDVEGEKVGIALFEHPSSFHHPSRWHVRDYGLLAVNPFGSNAFDKALPVQNSVLEAGRILHLRYRVVVHPPMSQAEIEKLYRKFAGL
jgi:Methane oxygenase PmoA